MNKNLHRIIFNARRGIRMVVAETASAQGKRAQGETGRTMSAGVSLLLVSGLYAMPLNAQIIADRAAPGNQRATILSTASGVTQVNIQTPSRAGVSRNTYSQFDITSKGAILNNGRADSSTQIGGYVQANPWLATGAARVILNEVNSSNPSQIRGYVEVAGQRAEVIIANPAGIAVNGGGFLNASAVTLTTGTPVMNAGSLESFKVHGGVVTIDGTGLDTSTADYTNILARAAQVNAGIWAKDLKIVTGANDISASNAAAPTVTASTSGTDTAPAYALDVATLGGMYAGKIYLVGTEAGVGVRNSGVIGATAGDVILTENGLLTNSGSIYATGKTSITTQGSIANTGTGLIAAQGNTTLNAQGSGGTVTSQPAATIAAGMDTAGNVGNSGSLTIAAATSATLSGKVAAGADANLSAPDLITDGATVTAAQINITAHDLSNLGGKLLQSGAGDMTIRLPGNLNNTGGTIASNAQNLSLAAATLTNTGGTISHAGTGALGVTAQTLQGAGGTIVSNGALAVNATGAVNLQGATTSAQNVSITAASLDNSAGHLQASGGATSALSVTTTGALTNTAGSIYSAGGTTINAGSLTNTGTTGTAGGTATIAAQGNTTINAQTVNSNANSLLAAGMQTDGKLVSNASGLGNLTISTTGAIQAIGQNLAALTASLSGASVDVSKGQTGGSDVSLMASSGDVTTQGAAIVTPGTLTVAAQSNAQQTWNNSAPTSSSATDPKATIQAGQLAVSVANLNNQGARILQTGTGAADITLKVAGAPNATGVLNNSGGTIAVNATNLTLGAATINNASGSIRHVGAGVLAVNAGTFSGNGGTLASNGALRLNATGAVDLQNAVTSAQQVSIAAASLGNQGGRIVQTSATTPAASIAVSGALDNTGGFIGSNGAMQVNAGSVTNANGQITALQSLALTSSGAVNNSAASASAPTNTKAGLIQSNGALNVQAASLDNTGATISSAQSSVTVNTTGQTTNTAGKITAAGDANLTSTTLRNDSSGLIGANGGVTVNSDTIQNAGGQIVGVGNVTIAARTGTTSAATSLDNTAGLVQSGATLSVNAGQVTNAGTYTAPSSNATALGLVGKDVQLTVGTLSNQGGEVLAGNNLTVSAGQSIDNSTLNNGQSGGHGGLLYAGRVLKVQDSALNINPVAARALQVSNTGGTLNAGTSNQLKAAGISGDGQLLSQGDLSLDVSGDFNNTGTVNANGNASITSGGTVNNSGTLSSGKTLSVAAVNLNNAAKGVLSGTTGTNVTLGGTLNNRGLIDSGNGAGTSLTLIKAQTVNNIGTGRIYGDNVAIAANTLNNDVETVSGVTKTAVIASRNRLDLGVQTLNNSNGATILSLGDMAIGGALDANNRATGSAGTVINSASTIQSVNGNVLINTAVLQNLNPTFSYKVINGGTSGEMTEYILTNGQTVQDSEVAVNNGKLTGYAIAGGHVTPRGAVLLSSDPLATPTNIAIYNSNNVVTTTTTTTLVSNDGGKCGCNPVYSSTTTTTLAPPNDPGLWAYFGVTPPSSFNDTAAYVALQNQIDAVRSQMNARMILVQSYNAYTETTQQAVVNGGTPGTISSAGSITINAASSARNDNSRILAGGALNITSAQLDNTSTNVTVQSTKTGYNFNWNCVNFEGTSYCGVGYYNDPNWGHESAPQARVHQFNQTSATTVQVSNSQVLQYTTAPAATTQPAASAGGGGVSGLSLAGQASSIANAALIASQGGAAAVGATSGPLASKTAAASSQAGNPANRVASTTLNFKLPNSSLYQINSSPTAHYLVQTDPAFTNRKNWLSSDFISTQNALDPNVTQKRLGDGFYEQQLIREQVAQLTGQRFLGNYTNDDDQYRALMTSGLTFASKYNLREGIALSAAQVALLTSDIVWLEQQTVTLPDGSTTQALVPHVYAAIRDGDLLPSGALLAGNTVSVQASGDVNNSGTIAGRKLVQISADNINNTAGSISAEKVSLNAVQDINNIGGSISADFNLSLLAGRDINIASTTQQSSGAAGGYQFSQSGIDRVASLNTRGPGVLVASAGNNINFTAAQIKSAGDVQLSADNNLNLSTVTSSRSDNFNASDPNNHFLSSSSKDVGTNITSAGNTSLQAGNTFKATAAKVDAGGDLKVNANNIVLLAGSSKAQSDSVMTNTSGDMISSTTTVTKESQSSAKAQVNQLTGKNVTVTAEQDLVSVGSKFAATGTADGTGIGNLTVEGKNSQSFYAAKDVSSSNKSVDSSSSMLGGAINMGSKTTTDSSTQAVSVATQLESTKAINVRVGNSATFEGATISAPVINFQKTDPNKAGELNLNGSVDTTQTSHTEKSDTMGVYQSQSGSGSTTQTLNQTKINGNVTFDSGLQVAVQLPKTVTTSGDKANTAAAANATNTASQASVQSQIDELSKQPGLAYLKQLSSNAATNNPTQWSQVQLAHDNWSYQSQGLTPAGAALLSIAVAAYAPGLSSGLTSSITSVAGASAAAAVNAGFIALQAQAAVAMVNNGGNIGKTLEQLGSDQSIKNLLITMATAGALDKLDKTLFGDTSTANTVNGQTGAAASGTNSIASSQALNNFGQNLLKNVTNNVAGAAINSAISGKPFDENTLSAALTSALITAGSAVGANAIGAATMPGADGSAPVLNTFTQQVAHAVLGCATGAATAGNSSGCAPGAVGAVVGSMAVQFYAYNMADLSLDPATNTAKALAFAKTMSATAGVLVGGADGVQAVNIAATTGDNAAANNDLKDKLLAYFQDGYDKAKAAAAPVVSATKKFASDLINAPNDIINTLRNTSVAQTQAQTPLDVIDGNPPTAGGGTAVVTTGALVPACIPPVCTLVPVAGIATVPTGITLSTSNADDSSNNGSSNSSASSSGATGSGVTPPNNSSPNPNPPQIGLFKGASQQTVNTINEVIANGTNTTTGSTKNVTMPAGTSQANDFAKLTLDGTTPVPLNSTGSITGVRSTLPDGTTVIMRSGSTSGNQAPTIDIQTPLGNPVLKIRY